MLWLTLEVHGALLYASKWSKSTNPYHTQSLKILIKQTYTAGAIRYFYFPYTKPISDNLGICIWNCHRDYAKMNAASTDNIHCSISINMLRTDVNKKKGKTVAKKKRTDIYIFWMPIFNVWIECNVFGRRLLNYNWWTK